MSVDDFYDSLEMKVIHVWLKHYIASVVAQVHADRADKQLGVADS